MNKVERNGVSRTQIIGNEEAWISPTQTLDTKMTRQVALKMPRYFHEY
jgi:hypothetical protein